MDGEKAFELVIKILPWVAISAWLAWRVETKLSIIVRRVHQLTVVIGILLDLGGVDPAKIKDKLKPKPEPED